MYKFQALSTFLFLAYIQLLFTIYMGIMTQQVEPNTIYGGDEQNSFWLYLHIFIGGMQ